MLKFNEENKESDISSLEVKKKEPSQINLKFIAYRQVAESNERKLQEATGVINQLKEEKAIFEEIEKNLRSQISSSQNRLIQMHNILKNMAVIEEKLRESNEKSLQMQTTIEELNEIIKDIKESSNLILRNTKKDLHLIAENNELKKKLRAKELDYDLIKIELQSLQKEKKNLETQILKTRTLEEEIEKSKKEILESKTDWEETLLLYRKQIEYNEQIIRDYEKERKTLLEEFELPKGKIIDNNFENFTWADSTVSINREKSCDSHDCRRGELNSETTSSQLIKENTVDISLSNISQTKCDCGEKTPDKFGQNEKSQNQTLFSLAQTTQQEIPCSRIPSKRKLYSTNFNHYLT